jgi:RNA polymerase primary sigma factor
MRQIGNLGKTRRDQAPQLGAQPLARTRKPEPTKRVRSEHAELSGGSARDPLTQYFGEMKGHPVLGAADELALAQQIEQLEVACWQALLAHGPALTPVCGALRPHLREPRELAALRKQVGASRGARAAKVTPQSVLGAARSLRKRDVTRAAWNDAYAAVRSALGATPGGRSYLERVAKAVSAHHAAKNRFMLSNLRLVVALARRYDQRLMPLGDLIQEGNLGLMRAVERFDPSRGFRFSTYATWWIRHGFNRALSDRGRLVRLPVHLLDDAQRVAKERAALTRADGQLPSHAELAQKTGLSEEKVTFIASHAAYGVPSSLDRPLGDDGETTLLDVLASPNEVEPDAALDAERWSAGLEGLLGTLSAIEAAVLRFRFGLNDGQELSLSEIGDKYNLSRERIRQLQVQALSKLRAQLRLREGELRAA